MKALHDTYVPVGTSSDNVAVMINQVIRGHQISFCDEDFPFEGRLHNKALHHCHMLLKGHKPCPSGRWVRSQYLPTVGSNSVKF